MTTPSTPLQLVRLCSVLAVGLGAAPAVLPAADVMTLGNQVWNDTDHNGTYDPGESGIAGVGVSLYADGGDGIPASGDDYGVMWTSTDADGRYQFTEVPAGSYFIRIEYGSFAPGAPLFGLLSTTGEADPDGDADDGDDNGLDTPFPLYRAVHSPVFTVTPGAGPTTDGDDENGNQTLDFGFHATAEAPVLSLGNLVWLDDGDGVREGGEPGISGVGMNLYRDLGAPGRDGMDEQLAGTGTDAEGGYRFDGLPPGDYLVELGSWNFNQGGALFGLMSSPGVADPESHVDNDDSGVDSPMPVNWGIASGRIVLAAGAEPTDDGDGADSNQTLDFGLWSPPEPPILVLGGSVWRDLDADGQRDAGEAGLPNVGLSIIEVLPDNSEIHQGGGGTDAEGNYRFHGRPAGNYYVRVDSWNFNAGAPLAGLVSSAGVADANTDGLGDDNGQDMPMPRNWGLRTHVVELRHGLEPTNDGDDANGNLTVDFGMIPALTLGDLVFSDANGDGVFNAGDAGVDGVNLHLFQDRNANDVLDEGDWHLASTPTAGGGRYAFTELAPGDYLVLVGGENFGTGGALFGKATSPLDETDPDADGDNNDNGLVRPPHGVISGAMTLHSGGEPTDDGDGADGNLTLDFGFQTARTLTLGNLVFRDENNNGRRDAGEAGKAGVTVKLYRDTEDTGSASPGDELVGTAVTDGDGRFEFTDLTPTEGNRPYVLLVPAVNFAAGGPLAGWVTSDPSFGQSHDGWADGYDHGWNNGSDWGVSTWHLHLNPGQLPITEDGDANTDLTADLGFTPEFRVGDRVWADLNGNGEREAGEPGMPGVGVQLWRDDGDGVFGEGDSHVQDAGTDYGGRYEFRGVTLGNYFVAIPPGQNNPGQALYNRVNSTANDPVSDPANDLDDDDNGRLVSRPEGEYVVSGLVVLTVGGEPTTEDGDPNTNLTVDFGFVQGPLPSVGNLVWNDVNNDGVRDDGEPGIGGVGVSLYADDGDGVGADDGDGLPNTCCDYGVMWTTTGPDGLYQFTGVPPGRYFIRIEYGSFAPGQPLFGFVSSTGVAEPDADLDDNDDNGMDEVFPLYRAVHSPVFTVNAAGAPTNDGDDDQGNQTIDFGFHAPADGPVLALGNLVWRDDGAGGGVAGDGLRQPGEPGIPNVGIGITWAGADGMMGTGDDQHLGHAWTDGEGRFQVVGLAPGNYRLSVDNWNFYGSGSLLGFLSSPGSGDPNALTGGDGDDNGVDAPVPVSSGIQSEVVELTVGAEPTDDGDDANGNQTLDFGFYSPAEPPALLVGGTLWQDLDGNGSRDSGEPGVANVGLTLLRRQPDGSDFWIYGGNTDEHGDYRFNGLPAGTYRVIVWNWNFNPGGPLADRFSSPGAADPDADVKGDDNGADALQPAQASVYSRWITLTHGAEPGEGVDGDDANGNQTLDLGFIELPGGPVLSMGGTVFRDLDNNGLLDGADTGIPNAFVALWIDNGDGVFGEGDTHIGSYPATDADGGYRFDSLPPADYFLQMYGDQFRLGGPLAGLRSSLSDQSPEPVLDPNDGVDGDDNGYETATPGNPFMVVTTSIALRPEDPNPDLTVDFGLYEGPTLELAGTVFHDVNNNGLQDDGQTGIAGAWVEVWLDSNRDGVPSDGDSQLLGTATDAQGAYRFVQMVPGDYLVLLRYHNFLPGRPLNGLRSSLSDQSPEPAADANADADGNDDGFEFGGWGRAFVGVGTRPVALAYGTEPDTEVDGDGPNSNATVDFGFHPGPTSAVGNLVFLDDNNNGRHDESEPGIQDVHVKLFYDQNGDGVLSDGDEDLGVDVATGEAGIYSLPGLPAGEYLVVLPWDNWWPGRPFNGLRSSTGNGDAPDPNLDTTDGDDNGQERVWSSWPSVQVASGAFTVAPGDQRPDLDFGFYAGPTLSVAGTVFRDEDNGGTQNSGEAGIPGVAVQLFQDNGDGVLHHGDWQIGEAVTDGDGMYRFSGLMPGHYAAVIRRDNHFYGRALTNLRTSTGNDPAPDPDDDVDGDDNGAEVSAFDDPNFGVASLPVTLAFGDEPDMVADGDDTDSNATLDFGFRPVTGTTFVVNTTDDLDDGVCDSGHCSLREALNAANANPGTDTIAFDIGGGGWQTIQPVSALPQAIEPVVLDATTQPGYAGLPLIELSGGGGGGGGAAGLVLWGGHSTVRGFIINRFEYGGIHLYGASHNVIQGNFIGTDPTGTAATGGTTSEHGGIYLSGSNDNQIGGATAATRNVVSGNNVGIRCDTGWRNGIEGNYVGTDLTGTVAVGNYGRAGVWVLGGADNRVGGAEAGAGNLISGNNGAVDWWAGTGLLLEWSPGTVVHGNRIGTDITGTAAIGNQLGLGASGPGLTIGGTEAGSGNLVSGNRHAGVNMGGDCRLIGNLIGTDFTGTQPLGNGANGVGLWGTANIVGGTTAAERNVISANRDDGIAICGSPGRGDNVIQGNYIGTDITGTVALGNGAGGWGPGIRTCGDNNFNVIGGAAPGAGNLIAGNHGSQVDLRSSDNLVAGNLIGTDATGTVALLPASPGVGLFENAGRNGIRDNLISGVDRAISLSGPGVRATRISGNRLGTDASGTAPVPNTVGVDIYESADNVIGGVAPGEGNTIAFSSAYGLVVSGDAALNNVIRGNSIHSNGSLPGDWLGIDLAYGPPVTPNDPGDADAGPNHLQNYPVLLQAAASGTALAVEGILDSAPNTTFVVDLYSNPVCDPTGHGEGELHLGSLEVTTDAAGDASFHGNLELVVPPGRVVTATATDPAGNTSEFSACREVVAEGPPTILQAATSAAPDQIVVFFSESVDPVSATDPGHYSPGCAGVLAAVMLDPRTVRLTLDAAVPGPGCVLTVNGIHDLASPPNTMIAGTVAEVFSALGVITRREYHHIPGGQVWDLVNHPRFPESPSIIAHPALFESLADLGDNYGVQMLGYVHPPVTGEYVFYLAADEQAELYLSGDEDPDTRRLVAVEVAPNPPRQWTGGNRPLGAAPEEVLTADTLFIEAEDFNHGAGQYVTGTPIGMDGPYAGGAYADLGTTADAEIDWHDSELDNHAGWSGYRASTGVECYTPGDRGDRMERGTFEVLVSHSLGWQDTGDWQNYTRDFGAPRDYYVYARLSSGGAPIALQLDEVVGGATTPSQSIVNLGGFYSPPTGGYDLYALVPLTDGNGVIRTVNLGGERTLRTTVVSGNNEFDYLALLPVTGPAPTLRTPNVSAPIHLVGGQRYYLEVLMKEGGGADHLGVAWQTPGSPPPANGDAPIDGAHLEAWVDPHVTPAPLVSLGGLVFRDENNNGRFEPPEDTAIPGVEVTLWMDANLDNVLHHGDWTVGTTVTDPQGRYHFGGLHPAGYLVAISKWEQYFGRALSGTRTSTGNDPAPDPDNDVPGEDNGYEDSFFDGPVGDWIATRALTLTAGGEPDPAVDGDDTSGNQTLDFGFRPVAGTTFIVTTADDHDDGSCDAGDCSLREAINAANLSPGADRIEFNIPGTDPGYDGATGAFVIRLTQALPALIEDGTTLDGRTQAAFGGDTNPLGPEIRIEVPAWPAVGLQIEGNHHRIFGLNLDGHQASAILVFGGDNWIAGCYIGTDPTGSTVINRPQGIGISLNYGRSHDNIVGTNGDGVDDALEGNIVAGCDRGIEVAGVPLAGGDPQGFFTGRPRNNWIAGNRIGVDRTGTVALGNGSNYGAGHGVLINGATETLVGTNGDGTSDDLERNIISASEDSDVMIRHQQWDESDRGGDANVIAGNYIGTDITGTVALSRPDGPVCDGVELMMGVKFNRIERNLISGHLAHPSEGVLIMTPGTDQNLVRGNLIGVDVSGTRALPNAYSGVAISQGASHNLVEGNLVSGNLGAGVNLGNLESVENQVLDNHIGTDQSGANPIPNGWSGVYLYAGPTRLERNLISGNAAEGIFIGGTGTGGHVVAGNLVGTDVSSALPLPNVAGIAISESSDNRIGGVDAGAGNVIAFNTFAGVWVGGDAALRNAIRGNSIHDNGSAGNATGIDLVFGDLVTPNDPGDADEGPNRVQNHPGLLLASASDTSLMVEGTLGSTPDTAFAIDFYAGPACHPTGYGEGQSYLGSIEVLTDATGTASFLVNLATTVAPGSVLTATATDPEGNTSEFSRCAAVQPEGPPVLMSASTQGLPNRVTLVFSESLEPAAATDLAHYDIPGVAVLAATLGADGRTVVLETTLLPDGSLTIGYAGLMDRATPPNVVPPGTVSTILNTQGYLTRSVWYNVPGTRMSQLTSLASYPDDPDELTYEPWFEAPDDVADHYGQRLAGYLTPPVTGDYTFYLASDDSSELWLSTDADPANKRRIAGLFWGLHSEYQKRAWNSGAVNAPPDQVFRPGTLFIEAEDFDFGGRQQVTGAPIGMDGPYAGGAYAGLGGPADEGLDFHEFSADAAAEHYRPATGIEIYPVSDPVDDPHGKLGRGSFDVDVSWKVAWNYVGEWYNYTREFPAPAQEYYIYAHAAADGPAIAAELDILGYDAGPEPVSVTKLGRFTSNSSSGWDNFVQVPLVDDLGQPVAVSLTGLQTLRVTILPGGFDFDYLVLVPVTPDLPVPVTRAENISEPIHLEAGTRYYIEALGRENGGGDHLSVTWQMPGAAVPANGDPPIPGQYLSSLSPSGPVSFTEQPLEQTVDERGGVAFSVKVAGTPPFTYQWLRNGEVIPGATSSRLEFTAVVPDDGARFSVVVANAFSQDTSAEAVLHVVPDTLAPAVASIIGSPGLDRVTVRFSEPVAPGAADPARYSLNGGLAVLAAVLEPDLTTVVLQTTPQVPNVRYTLGMAGVTDLAHVPNPVAPGTAALFSSWAPARGFVLHRFFQDTAGNYLDALRNDPRYPDRPTLTESLGRVEWPPDGSGEGGSNYGNQLGGWLVPPVSGDYVFYVAADDQAELWLSTDDAPANKRLLCFEPEWNNPRDYRTLSRRNPDDPENISDPVHLEAGSRYYFEILHTEGGGGDNVSLAWQLPGAPEVQSGDLPIAGEHVESYVNPDLFAATLAAIDPAGAAANGGAFTLTVTGAGFRADSVVHWNGGPRATTYVSDTTLEAAIPADDLVTADELRTATITVVNFLGVASNPKAFTIAGSRVTQAQSDVVSLGETTEVSAPPASETTPGVTTSVQNEGSPEPVVVSTATYESLPVAEPPKSLIDVGGGYVDVQVTGADPADTATSHFYYPANLDPVQEAAVTLLYYNGSAWVAVLSSGGVMPLKDTTDNLDGTLSGGRFTVVFDSTSSPTLQQLTGSVFSPAGPESFPPVAVDDPFVRADDDVFKVRVAALLANDSDPDHDPLVLTGFEPVSARGGTVWRQGAWILYRSLPGDREADSFGYTISDGRNGLASARVLLLPPVDPGEGRNLLDVQIVNGEARLQFAGIPGRTYQLQYTADLGSGLWTDLGSAVVCGTDGLLLFADPSPTDPMRFYRTVSP